MKKTISPGAIARKLSAVACRFPLAVACIAAMATLTLLVVHGFEDDINYRWWVFFGIAMLGSVTAALASEQRWSRIGRLLAGVGVVVVWGVRCLFFPADNDDLTTPQLVEIGVISVTIFLAAFFTAFLRRGGDVQWWNFSVKLLLRLVLGSIFSGILFGGFMLAIFAVTELFAVNPPDEIFGWLAVACFIVFEPLYVMAGIPDGEDKRDGEARPSPVLKVLALYILGPILAAYTLILYLYLLKIVITWELPNGWVSWLVTTLAIGGLVVALLLYPLRMRGGNRLVEFLARWTGVIISPLLVLMTVGIARRISDYGLTPNRCYILLLNIWFYGIYAYLFFVRCRRVKWILISAVIVAFVSSVGPWSLARITPRQEVDESALIEDEKDYPEWFSSDSTLTENTPQLLVGEYDRLIRIVWGENDLCNGHVSLTERGGELVIGLYENEDAGEDADAANETDPALGMESRRGKVREFIVPLQFAAEVKEIRGSDFLFLVDECYGARFPVGDSIRVTHLSGYLFY